MELERKQFVEFLKDGMRLNLMVGMSYEELADKLSISDAYEPSPLGDGQHWFQDALFWFSPENYLYTIELLFDIPDWASHMPRLINSEWPNFAMKLVPETFEALLHEERIPSLKTTQIEFPNQVETFFPPFYVLDHCGLLVRFQERKYEDVELAQPYLSKIEIILMRSNPNLYIYEQVYPKL